MGVVAGEERQPKRSVLKTAATVAKGSSILQAN